MNTVWNIFFLSLIGANAGVMYFGITHDQPIAVVGGIFSAVLCTAGWFQVGKATA